MAPSSNANSGTAHVVFPEKSDHVHAPAVREELIQVLDSKPELVRLDLQAVTRVDSTALAVLLSFLSSLTKESPDTKVRLLVPTDSIRRILQLTKLEKFKLDIAYEDAA